MVNGYPAVLEPQQGLEMEETSYYFNIKCICIHKHICFTILGAKTDPVDDAASRVFLLLILHVFFSNPCGGLLPSGTFLILFSTRPKLSIKTNVKIRKIKHVMWYYQPGHNLFICTCSANNKREDFGMCKIILRNPIFIIFHAFKDTEHKNSEHNQ